jgi:hypothetical protein
LAALPELGQGIMGYGKLGYWVLFKENLLTRKLINEKLPVRINIPIFHHSMGEAKTLASKNPLNINKL